MSSELAIVMMDASQARTCVEKIKDRFGEVRTLVLDLYEREGWKALGYKNWTECASKEFGNHKVHTFRLLAAAQAERNISNPGVTDAARIPEKHLRPLTSIKDPEQQRAVWKKAVETAPKGKVTAAHVKQIAEKIRPSKPKKESAKPPEPIESSKKISVLGYKGGAINECRRVGEEMVRIIHEFPPDDLWFIPTLDAIQEAIDFARTKHGSDNFGVPDSVEEHSVGALGPKATRYGKPYQGIISGLRGKAGELYGRAVLNRLVHYVHCSERQEFVEALKASISRWQKDNPKKSIQQKAEEQFGKS